MLGNLNLFSKSLLIETRIIWFDTTLKIFSFIFNQRFDFIINPGSISVTNGNYFIQNKVTHDIENSFCKNEAFSSVFLS